MIKSLLQSIALVTIVCFSDSCSLVKPNKQVNSPAKINEATTSNFGKELHKNDPEWAHSVNQEVLKLGNFNWIVVAEPAFPSLNRKGVTIITAEASSPEVLWQVFDSMETNGHVLPKIYLSRESKALIEEDTPGIIEFKKLRDLALNGREARYLTDDALQLLLVDAKQDYRILIIKTNTLLPYSSIFIELESGYWDGIAETALRKRMIR